MKPDARDSFGAAAAGPALWSTYWRDTDDGNRPHERCHVPGDGRAAVDGHWAAFAGGLPKDARVIDLACGAGVVGRTLLRRRGDLHVTGIDWADVAAADAANLTILPRISMEALPFDDGGFDAAVSLFGIEYGKIDRVAAELARVLKPGAPFSFIVHHHDSEILREGGVRRRALRAVTSGRMRAAFLASGAEFDRHRAQLAAQFPGEPSLKLFADYFRRNIGLTRAGRQALWQRLAADLDPEIALLGQLECSAKSAATMGVWLAALLATMTWVGVSVLRGASGGPVAWVVGGAR